MAVEGTEYMLYVGSDGIDDPNQAGLVFAAALAAVTRGYTAQIALLADAVLLMTDAIARNTIITPIPPKFEPPASRGSVAYLLTRIAYQIPIWV